MPAISPRPLDDPQLRSRPPRPCVSQIGILEAELLKERDKWTLAPIRHLNKNNCPAEVGLDLMLADFSQQPHDLCFLFPLPRDLCLRLLRLGDGGMGGGSTSPVWAGPPVDLRRAISMPSPTCRATMPR